MSSAANSPATNSNSDDEQSRSKWHMQLNADTPSPNSTTTTPISTPTSLYSFSASIQQADVSGSATAGGGNGSSGTPKRKSAFLPYRPQATVLTNLQRGNTEATFCPVEVTLSFHERAGQGEITDDQVRLELERNAHNIDFKDALGFTALHWAAYYGQLAAVRLLVDAGANVNAEAPEMVTPLLLAACGGHNDVVRLLLEHGACATHMDIVGNTALMYAAAGNHPHTCNELLAKDPDMTLSNENGDTAYSLAVENGAVLAQAVLEQFLSALLLL
ncbi:DNA-binding protein RFXANK [Anastrepha ludens]|uniref:DNA-binding protein RFXANK n=1 Tax=Anastrepha ludens TaxID=28586 RepID=UPI0023B1D2DA|nr:DNA-binding protein RFXANK [Anastrepha ludens]XP_053961016.1 DNA-binding protein RFXANK [Anastrepha ludens]XP_053961017.1 DNA-binding protein RFXANK [Anastrepha ludens]